jgi:hypothetical protein
MEFVKSHKSKCQPKNVRRLYRLVGVINLPSEETSDQNEHDADCQVMKEMNAISPPTVPDPPTLAMAPK